VGVIPNVFHVCSSGAYSANEPNEYDGDDLGTVQIAQLSLPTQQNLALL
jgi:hypothetical protein